MHPTKGKITQHFNTFPQASGEPWGHTGVDYAGNIGDEIVTIADGVVLFADWGQNMPVDMANRFAFVPGSDASGILTLIEHPGPWWEGFAHKDTAVLNVGQKVVRGQKVGTIGTTGRSTGAHLHYETIDTEYSYNPLFGRYDPLLQIEWEDREAARLLPLLKDVDMTDAQLKKILAAIEHEGSETRKVIIEDYYLGRGANRKVHPSVISLLQRIVRKLEA